MSDQTREEVDAKIARSKAEIETSLARFEGKIDGFGIKLDAVEKELKSIRGLMYFSVATTISGALALAALIIRH